MTVDNVFLFQVIDAVRSAGAVYGMAPTDTPFTYIVEYASPNTNKPLHLGHMRNIALGQALIAFLTYCGHQVIATEIINDRGIHIMKSILAYQKWGNNETPESTGMKGDHFVGMYYVLFSQRAKEDPTLEEDAQKLLQRYEQGEQEICSLWKQMNTWVADGTAIYITQDLALAQLRTARH